MRAAAAVPQRIIQPEGAPFVRPQFDSSIEGALQRQAGRIRRREYLPLGRLEKLYIEASGVYRVDSASSLVGNPTRSASLDWYNQGPLVAQSEDGREILIPSPLAAPPRIPDPSWTRPLIYEAVGKNPDGSPVVGLAPCETPMIEQKLEELSAGVFQTPTRQFLVFQPVHQLLIVRPGKGWMHVNFTADAQGRHACLVWDRARQSGHFLFGSPEIRTY